MRLVRDDSARGMVVLVSLTFLAVLGGLSLDWGLAQCWLGLVR